MRVTILIEGNILSTFDDETIELNSSVANTDDVTKISSDYTKSFTVPANETNNAIFKHYYNADIDNTFDSRTKKSGSILIDGFLFREGKFRLEKVVVKNREPYAYTLNFWGNLINIKDKFKADEISGLPLSALNHDYTAVNVFAGLTDVTPTANLDNERNGIIYNLISNKKQFYFSTVASTDTDKLVNIKANDIDFRLLKPSVQVYKLILAIEAKYDIVFSRHFFSRNDFKKLYLWCNPDTSDKKNNKELLTFNTGTYFAASGFFNDFQDKATTSFVLTLTAIGDYTVTFESAGVVLYTNNATGNSTHQVGLGYQNTSFQVFITSDTGVLVTGTMQRTFSRYGFATVVTNSTITNQGIGGGTFNVALNLPKIKVIDFMKGLFQMFKLVAIPLPDGTVYINNVDDFYRGGTVYDITDYIDFENIDVERGVINEKLDFKYQPPTTILNKKFLENTGVAYGDEVLNLTDSNGEPLDGEQLEIVLPFEQVVYERLSNTSIQYALILDEKLETVNPKPILFFNNRTALPALSQFRVKGGASPLTLSYLNNPSQCLGLDTPTTSLNWGVENSSWNGMIIEKTLFSEYWKDYILAIYNIKRRTYKFKAVLPTYVLLKLKLNDILEIENRYYRINDFTVNLLTNETSLNLVNSFDVNFGIFAPATNFIEIDKLAQSFSIYVSNPTGMTTGLVSVGFGTSWLTATANGYNIDFVVSANTSGIDRQVEVHAGNNLGQSFVIYLEQKTEITPPI